MRPLVLAVFVAPLCFAGPPMTQQQAELEARARWFEFELEEVKTDFKGDWVAFVKAKEARERQLDAEGLKAAVRDGPAPTAKDVRALRALRAEYELVATKREDELRALAKLAIAAMQKGDLEPLVGDCTMYDATAKDRAELTRKFFAEQKLAWQKAATLAKVDAPDFARDFEFEGPSPETGMTAQVRISFGPKAQRPAGERGRDLFPERHQLELWWSGEVMPDANGRLNGAPTTPRPKSRWRFYQLVLPYSLRPMHRL
ncbi:MAG: hypothetical protein JNJ54_02755 [Myxococcaceae bacterium]|nr:hypothetical protein [Myxococcaceae bacterium]